LEHVNSTDLCTPATYIMLKLTEFHHFVLAIITFVVVTVVYVLLVATFKFKGNKFNRNTLTELSNKSRVMKKIGGAYMLLGGFAGMIHTAFSLYVRQDVTHPGNDFLLSLSQSNLYNVIITLHGCFMVLFTVQFIKIECTSLYERISRWRASTKPKHTTGIYRSRKRVNKYRQRRRH
jgi:hypothetical protein